MKYQLIRKSKVYDLESAVENLKKERDELISQIYALNNQIEKMKHGERACGNHCAGCVHSYIKREVSYMFLPNSITYGCLLDAKAACHDFEQRSERG